MPDAPRVRVEVLTPRGPGGVAVLAIGGEDRLAEAGRLLRAAASGAPTREPFVPISGRPTLAFLVDPTGRVLDEVLAFDRPGRARVEIHIHGSAAVLDTLATFCDVEPAPVAATRAERLLREASGDAQLDVALEQIECADWRPDFDRAQESASTSAATRAARAAALRRRSAVARALFVPARVVLCGLQNAGKSTLMNRLLFRERVLAGAAPGLTRDAVREVTVLEGYPYELVDVAGHGEVDSAVDRRALEIARRERDRAELLLLVVDAAHGLSSFDRDVLDSAPGAVVIVRNKIDLLASDRRWRHATTATFELTLSAIDVAAAPAIRRTVGAALRLRRGLPIAGRLGGPATLP